MLWDNGGVLQTWNNGANNSAIFGGTNGTVTLTVPISARNLFFAATGYTVAGNTLTLGGLTPTITASVGSATISSAITGTAGLTTAGPGVLTLSGVNSYSGGLTLNGTGTVTLSNAANTYTGPTTINGGTLQISAANRLPASTSVAIANAAGATLNLNGFAQTVAGLTGGGATGGAVTLGAGTLTINQAPGTNQFAGVITGTGGLTKNGAGTVMLSGANTYSGTTTITAGTLQLGAGGTSGSVGTGAIANSGALVIDRSNALTLSNVISGTGTLRQAGAGTTTLTATSTYTGATTIASGALQIGNGGTTGALAAASAIVNGGTLILNRSNAVTFANAIGGSGDVTKLGAGVTSLTGSNSYTGLTTIGAGTLSVGAGGTTGDLGASSSVVNNATLQINRSNAISLTQDISGTGALTKLGAGTATLTGANTYSGTTTITAGTLEIGAGGTSGSVGSGNITVTGGTTTLQLNRSDTITLGQVISGTGRLTQAGTGRTVLTGANTFSGPTTIAAGTLQLGAGGTSGSVGTGAIANSGALLIDRSNALTLGNVISGTGTLRQAGGGTTTFTGTNTYTGTTTIASGALQIGNGGTTGALAAASAIVNDGTLILNRSNAVTFANAISGSGDVTKLGAGVTSLTGSNSYTGLTTIGAGTLSVGAGGTTGDLGASSSVVNNATLQINRSNAISLTQDISGTGALTKLGAGTATLTGANTYSGTTTITAGTLEIGAGGTSGSVGSGNITVTGGTTTLRLNRSDTITLGQVISGTGRLTQAGTGTTVLTGANTFSGPTTIAAGTLQLGAGGTSGSVGTGAIANSGALVIDRSDALTLGNVISGTGTLRQAGAGTTTLTATSTYTGITTIASGALQIGNGGTAGALAAASVIVNDGTLILNRSNTVTFANAIGGSGDVMKLGAGVTSLTGTNSYTGLTTITAGTLSVGNGGTTGDLGATSGIVNNATLRINRSNAITLAQDISGSGALTKLGAGTATLTGINTYSGTTSITGGTLIVNGSLASSALTAGSGTTLGGVGNIAGDVTIASGATIAPGQSPGTLTVGSLNLSPGSFLTYELATPGVVGAGINDLIVVASGLTLDGTMNVTNLPGFGFGTYRLFNYGGAFTDNSLQFGTLPAGYLYQLQTNSPGQIDLIVGAPMVQVWGGGSGTWAAGVSNWTDASASAWLPWGGNSAEFGGPGGTVSVEGAVDVRAIEFRASHLLTPGSDAGLHFGTNRGALTAEAGVSATIGVPIYGSGGVTILGKGMVVLDAMNSYSGGTIVDSGTLVVSSDSNLGAPGESLMLVNNAALRTTANVTSARPVEIGEGGGRFEPVGSTLVLDGVVSGSGTLTVAGDGVLKLAQANSFSGDAHVIGGRLAVATGASLGTGSRLLLDGGTLQGTGSVVQIERATTLAAAGGTFDTPGQKSLVMTAGIDGPGALIKTGDGSLTLAGTNTYSGGTLIAEGILRGNAGSVQGEVINNADLVFEQRDDDAFRGMLVGTGRLRKEGAGTLLLEGIHGLQGLTTVAEGTLALNGSLPGAVKVGALGGLRATGTIGGALAADGTVEPIGTLGVLGNVTFNPGSQLTVAIDAGGRSSTLISAGAASIEGATIAVQPLAGTFSRITHYALLHAEAGLTGSAEATPSGALEPFLSQDGTTLFATVLNMDLPLQPYARTPGALAVADAVDRVKGFAAGDLARGIRELTALDDDQLGAALDMAGGEIYASTPLLVWLDGESAADAVREEISNRVAVRAQIERSLGRSADRFQAGRARRAWFRLRGERSAFESAAAHAAHTGIEGFIAGVDWLRSRWLVGVGGSYAQGRLSLEALDQSSRIATPRAMVYAARTSGRWGVDAGIDVARASQHVERRLAFVAMAPTGRPLFGGVERTATSDPVGLTLNAWGQGRFSGLAGAWSARGSAGLRGSRLRMGEWQEHGADGLSLAAEPQVFRSTQADARLELTRRVGRVAPLFSASYKRELTARLATTTLRLGETPEGAFRVNGQPLPGATAIGVAGIRFMSAHTDMLLSYEVRRADRQLRHVLQLGFGFE